MKKTIIILGSILFALSALLPLGVSLSLCFGFTFKLISYTAFAVVTAILSVVTTVLSAKSSETTDNKLVEVLFSLLMPLSLINTAFYITECREVLIAVIMFIYICCSCYLTVKQGKPKALKVISSVLFALLLVPFGFYSLMSLTFGSIRCDTVVQSVESPSGAYYAEVIDSDQVYSVAIHSSMYMKTQALI